MGGTEHFPQHVNVRGHLTEAQPDLLHQPGVKSPACIQLITPEGSETPLLL